MQTVPVRRSVCCCISFDFRMHSGVLIVISYSEVFSPAHAIEAKDDLLSCCSACMTQTRDDVRCAIRLHSTARFPKFTVAEGKKDEYKIGTLLRERYDSFLGDYHPSLVYGISTNFDRTKNSLQLALSGLYPPSTKLRWNRELAWNPIPINSVPDKFDSLFRLDSCPAYVFFSRFMLCSVNFDFNSSLIIFSFALQVHGGV
ncbi:unnamed protein product [Trichogramma brassicae]|uniref:Uncharacterized protein n=1 Tax=Trichogramma brassicae TaxID=86971 RepID=A0A6H5I476_9HYME|nr:unnamed protein product [Trichogramma brassicae]